MVVIVCLVVSIHIHTSKKADTQAQAQTTTSAQPTGAVQDTAVSRLDTTVYSGGTSPETILALANGMVPESEVWGTPLTDVYLDDTSRLVLLGVEEVEQLPELPTGCEITAATMLVDYAGYPVSDVELDRYLPKSSDDIGDGDGVFVDTDDPDVAFIGDTRTEAGSSCNVPPVAEAVDDYIASQGGTERAVDLTGVTAEELYAIVGSGTPVEVWVTTGMSDVDLDGAWDIERDNGTETYFCTNYHAMTLIGYTTEDVILADPLDDIVVYTKEDFERVWTERGQMALMIEQR